MKRVSCPACRARTRQHKTGFTRAGSQRMWCRRCNRKYTPEPKPRGYSYKLSDEAINLRWNEMGSYRQIGRHLGISHTTVWNWFKAIEPALIALEARMEREAALLEKDLEAG